MPAEEEVDFYAQQIEQNPFGSPKTPIPAFNYWNHSQYFCNFHYCHRNYPVCCVSQPLGCKSASSLPPQACFLIFLLYLWPFCRYLLHLHYIRITQLWFFLEPASRSSHQRNEPWKTFPSPSWAVLLARQSRFLQQAFQGLLQLKLISTPKGILPTTSFPWVTCLLMLILLLKSRATANSFLSQVLFGLITSCTTSENNQKIL